MGNTINKANKSCYALILTPKETKKRISEEDIRKRAYEIYKENDDPSCSEQENWCYAERELTGFYL